METWAGGLDILMTWFDFNWLLVLSGLIAFMIFDFRPFELNYDNRPFVGLAFIALFIFLAAFQNFHRLDMNDVSRILEEPKDKTDLWILDRYGAEHFTTYRAVLKTRKEVRSR